MMLLIAVIVVVAATTMFTFLVRPKDLPQPEPVSPTRHLEERKAAIYENLRDLQFEYRVGKLSDADYQQTKLGLQKELAGVLAEIDRITQAHPEMVAAKAGAAKRSAARSAPVAVAEKPPEKTAAEPEMHVECPHCGATFPQEMRFCGECGKAMA